MRSDPGHDFLPDDDDAPEFGGSSPVVQKPRLAQANATLHDLTIDYDNSPLYRPMHRAPMAVLCIFDDGQETGEWVRLRGDRYTLGRRDCDITIPHDDAMSHKHAELVRVREGSLHAWRLTDLNSRNGIYVRVKKMPMRPGQILQIGRARLRFEDPDLSERPVDEDAMPKTRPTQTVDQQSLKGRWPSLVRLYGMEIGTSYPLNKSELWIGQDSARCDVPIEDDALIGKRHAKMTLDDRGRWIVHEGPGRNGVWAQMSEVKIKSMCLFQLGEQRFMLWVP